MKPYLVDVPVAVNIWIRPECQKMQFDKIKTARPSILFLISDGGRNEQEWNAIKQNRKIYEKVDWNCKVYKIYSDLNNGLYAMSEQAHDFIWKRVDQCIFLEDDQIPSVSFFRYCAELLEKYKDDKRINVICGMNTLGTWSKATSDYFFSRQGSIWGFAMWKRTYEEYNHFEYVKDPYAMSLLMQETKHNKDMQNRIKGYANDHCYQGHIPWTEFFLELGIYGQHQLQIVPKYNLITNMGYGSSAAHSDTLESMPHRERNLYNRQAYELEFPLNHPVYVIPDEEYERKRNKAMDYNTPLIHFRDRLERVCLLVKTGRTKYMFKRGYEKLTHKEKRES